MDVLLLFVLQIPAQLVSARALHHLSEFQLGRELPGLTLVIKLIQLPVLQMLFLYLEHVNVLLVTLVLCKLLEDSGLAHALLQPVQHFLQDQEHVCVMLSLLVFQIGIQQHQVGRIRVVGWLALDHSVLQEPI